MLVIGVAGKKRSGKDTFVGALQGAGLNVPVLRRALADPLKDEVHKYVLEQFGFEKEVLDDPNMKHHFRMLMQWWGTEFRRELFYDNYWLNRMEQFLEQYVRENVIVCIPDIRFPNEVQLVKNFKGINVQIIRPGVDTTDAHPSEKVLDDYNGFDYVLTNDGSIEQLNQWVKEHFTPSLIKTYPWIHTPPREAVS